MKSSSNASVGATILPLNVVQALESALPEFEERHVSYPQIKKIEQDLELLLHFGPPSRDVTRPGRTYLLVGESGAGKSTVLKRFRDRHPPVSEPLCDRMPVVYVEVPSSATRIATMRAILQALGVLVPNRITEADLTRRLVHHLREMDVRVVILDEAQHLINSKTAEFAYDTADWMKSLANSGIALVIAGLPGAATAYQLNIQLARRSAGVEQLAPFGFESADDRHRWHQIVSAVTSRLPLDDVSPLLRDEWLHRLHIATEGYIGRLKDFLSLLLCEAALQGNSSVTTELLIRVEERRRDVANPDWVNVFALESLEDYQFKQLDMTRNTKIRRGKRRLRQEEITLPRAA